MEVGRAKELARDDLAPFLRRLAAEVPEVVDTGETADRWGHPTRPGKNDRWSDQPSRRKPATSTAVLGRTREVDMTSTNSDAAVERADAQLVQKFLRSRVGEGARTGPFSVLFSPGKRSPYFNYAIPDDDARPTAAEVAALEQAFRIRERRPRLE